MKKRAGLSVTDYVSEQIGEIVVGKLYDTFIYINECGYIKLNSGGYRTRHTKNCINDLLPEGYSLNQIKGEWKITKPCGDSIPFEDNMKIYL